VALTHWLEDPNQKITPARTAQPRMPMIAMARYEMQIAGSVVALQAGGHKMKVAL